MNHLDHLSVDPNFSSRVYGFQRKCRTLKMPISYFLPQIEMFSGFAHTAVYSRSVDHLPSTVVICDFLPVSRSRFRGEVLINNHHRPEGLLGIILRKVIEQK